MVSVFEHFFFFKYLNVNICFYILLLLSTDVFENIEFDDDLEEILEAICKCFYTFMSFGLMSKTITNMISII